MLSARAGPPAAQCAGMCALHYLLAMAAGSRGLKAYTPCNDILKGKAELLPIGSWRTVSASMLLSCSQNAVQVLRLLFWGGQGWLS